MRLFKSKQLNYRFYTNNRLEAEVFFTKSGLIERIFLYNTFVDSMVEIDVVRFEEHNPSRYNYIQETVNGVLDADEAI
jgi:hypothetical protein